MNLKYLTYRTLGTQYPGIAKPEPVNLVKTTPKGWKLQKSVGGRAWMHLAEKYCLFDTEEEANAHVRRIAEENTKKLKALADRWHDLISEVGGGA